MIEVCPMLFQQSSSLITTWVYFIYLFCNFNHTYRKSDISVFMQLFEQSMIYFERIEFIRYSFLFKKNGWQLKKTFLKTTKSSTIPLRKIELYIKESYNIMLSYSMQRPYFQSVIYCFVWYFATYHKILHTVS